MAARSRSKTGKAKRSLRRPARNPILSPTSPEAQREALADRLAQETAAAFQAVLHPQDGPADHPVKGLHDAVREAYDVCTAMLDELQLDPPLACKRGCIHCCYNQVALTEPEALFLGLHLLGTRSPERLRELADKAQALADRLKGKSWQEIGMLRHELPCLFLEDGGCSIYPARPLACRGWNSVDEKMCLLSNLSGDALTPIENHPIVREIADGIQSGLLRGSSELGLEAGYLLMARATALLLTGDPEQGVMDTTAEWLDGKPFFGRKARW
ncbi:YkgJ family cysteine cluster protein [uncultured Pseudodesulfovibrio sp.]|uniref:YkgJ family cysteine cluster protein n=1 Tax=uncultured Pseudodesulfovibrio sp. TaxID=2035858 RepID=UPI0029C686E3|nr:YkgJ family cysteine cluster protein [uncultured Pseudodesulfovibrio sp.]